MLRGSDCPDLPENRHVSLGREPFIQTVPAAFKQLPVDLSLRNVLATTQFSNAVLTSQNVQHNPDLLFRRILLARRTTTRLKPTVDALFIWCLNTVSQMRSAA